MDISSIMAIQSRGYGFELGGLAIHFFTDTFGVFGSSYRGNSGYSQHLETVLHHPQMGV
jgi:hypothetical protein